MKLRLGNAAILAYRRLPYKLWYAIAEFVDNSTDAYLRGDNKALLDKQLAADGEVLSVDVSYDKDAKVLKIADNSMGMSQDELEASLVIGDKPIINAGRSEFGMGMKTASIWFADYIEIKTKKLGEDKEHTVKIDINKYVGGNDELEFRSAPKPAEAHYTVITLSGLQRRMAGSSLQKTKDFLGSIYRQDLRDGSLKLTVLMEEVKAPPSNSEDVFLKRDDGTKVVHEFTDLAVNDRKVRGWVGVLKPGYTGRSNAGFALIRHGRAVSGWLDAWRPDEIFGDARNDLINQRVTGEIYMDKFSASHTKDGIDWEHNDEEVLGEALKKICSEYGILQYAKKHNRGLSPDSERERLEAQHLLDAQLSSQKVSDTIKMVDVPSPELAKFTTEVLLQAAESVDPISEWIIDGSGKRARLYEIALSPNDPYYEFEILANADLRVIMNSAHPANFLHDESAQARLTHYHHVLLDAIAEWKCTQVSSPIEPSSIRLVKDRLFRSIAEADQHIE